MTTCPAGTAGFQTCCVADFQVVMTSASLAGWETSDTADLEVCVTFAIAPSATTVSTVCPAHCALTIRSRAV